MYSASTVVQTVVSLAGESNVQIPRAILETRKMGFEVPKPLCVRHWVDAHKVRRPTIPE